MLLHRDTAGISCDGSGDLGYAQNVIMTMMRAEPYARGAPNMGPILLAVVGVQQLGLCLCAEPSGCVLMQAACVVC
jgi:hypothetical protein